MTFVRVALVLVAVVGALGAVRVLDRRGHRGIPDPFGVPRELDLPDFPALGDGPALILFSHADCRACSGVRRILAGEMLRTIEIDGANEAALLDRYGIDGVPTTLVVDSGGAVRAGWVGPVDERAVSSAIKALGDEEPAGA